MDPPIVCLRTGIGMVLAWFAHYLIDVSRLPICSSGSRPKVTINCLKGCVQGSKFFK